MKITHVARLAFVRGLVCLGFGLAMASTGGAQLLSRPGTIVEWGGMVLPTEFSKFSGMISAKDIDTLRSIARAGENYGKIKIARGHGRHSLDPASRDTIKKTLHL